MEGMSFAGPFWLTSSNDYGVVEIDFTEPYQEWANGRRNNYGFVVYSPQMGDNNGEASFRIHSSDHWD